jgi:hypothetical protein
MRAFVLATLFVASCSATYLGAVSSQYQAHDGHGGFSYGYSDPLSQKHEARDAHGITHGKYSYVDAHGHTQTVKYTADPIHGFQAEGTNFPKGPSGSPQHYSAPVADYHHYHHGGLPVAPHKTPEVIAAEHAHFAAHAAAKGHHLYKRSTYGYAPVYSGPFHVPVIKDGVPLETPEVQHAKAKHFAALAEAQAQPGYGQHYDEPEQYNNHHHQEVAPYHHEKKYSGPIHIPIIKDGVPLETPEVQHAKAKHFAAFHDAPYHHAPVHHAPAPHHHEAPYHHHQEAAPYHHEKPYSGPIHVPVIKDGVPVETPEVQHAKHAHYAALAEAHATTGFSDNDDGSYDEKKYNSHHY